MYSIYESTIGFAPDKSEFKTAREAVNAVRAEAEYYKTLHDEYKKAKRYCKDGNITKNAYRYSERWHICHKKTGKERVLWINRIHFANGRALVTVESKARFWNYKR